MAAKTRSGQTHMRKVRVSRYKFWAADTPLEDFVWVENCPLTEELPPPRVSKLGCQTSYPENLLIGLSLGVHVLCTEVTWTT
jgi:hypothetical protein